jgi:tetratricopeptide (TPR) repeat protein
LSAGRRITEIKGITKMILCNYYVRTFALVALLASSSYSATPGAPSYDELVQQGKGQLQSGHPDQAAASGKAAIKMSMERWEGYALVGGALINEKRYEEAADTLSKAIERAPESKQPALRDLRRQCLLADTGTPAATSTAAPATSTTQAEIVLWKSIENSANPADYQSYLDQYPQGAFAGLARQHQTESQTREQDRLEQERIERTRRDAAATWFDRSTGLTWTKHEAKVGPDDAYLHWSEGVDYCNRLGMLSARWRLPSYDELKDLKRRSLANMQISSDTDVIYTNKSDLTFALKLWGNFGGTFRVLCVSDSAHR